MRVREKDEFRLLSFAEDEERGGIVLTFYRCGCSNGMRELKLFLRCQEDDIAATGLIAALAKRLGKRLQKARHDEATRIREELLEGFREGSRQHAQSEKA